MKKTIVSLIIASIFMLSSACSAIPANDAQVQPANPNPCTCSNAITVQHPVLPSETHTFIYPYCDCGITGDFASAIAQKQLISPSEAAEKAAVGLLTWYGSDFGLLTTNYQQVQDQIYAVVTASRKNSAESQHRCTVDAKTGTLLEIVDLSYDDAWIGQEPLDTTAPALDKAKQDVLDSAAARFGFDNEATAASLQEATICSVAPFAQGDFQWMVSCNVRTKDGVCYTLAIPCPSVDGSFYSIQFFEDDWDACRTNAESVFHFE